MRKIFKIKQNPCCLFLILLFASCQISNQQYRLDQRDSTQILNLAINSKNFIDDFNELNPKDRTIYVVKDTVDKYSKWPNRIGNINIRIIDKFNQNRDFREQGRDPRFTISQPKMVMGADTLLLSIYSFKFYTLHEFKFVRQNESWKIVKHSALMQ